MVSGCTGFVDNSSQFRACVASKTSIIKMDVDALRSDSSEGKLSAKDWEGLCKSRPDDVRALYQVPVNSHFDRVQYAVSCATVFGLDPYVVMGVIFEESRFDPDASNKDSSAIGLMQLTVAAVKDSKDYLKKQVDKMAVSADEKVVLKARIDGLSPKGDFIQSCFLGCAYLKLCESKSSRSSEADRTADMLGYYRLGPYTKKNILSDPAVVEYRRRNSLDAGSMKLVYPSIQTLVTDPIVKPRTLLASFSAHFSSPCRIVEA